MRREKVSLLFAFTGLLILSVISSITSPEKVYLVEIEKHEGKTVIVEGVIEDIDITSGGNMIIKLRDESGVGKVFVYGEKDVFVGDKIKATGGVQRYREEYEIVADVIVKLERETKQIKIWQMAKDPQKYLNTYIIATGYVRNIENDLIELEEDSYTIRITKPLMGENISKGDRIEVRGKLLYDPSKLSYYILSVEVEKID